MARRRKKKRPNNKLYLHLELLQNGESLNSVSHPIAKRAQLTFGSHPSATLEIPQYSSNTKFEIAVIDKLGPRLTVDPSWDGFISTREGFIEFSADTKKKLSYDIERGDYGTIYAGDLQIIFKLAPKAHVAQKVRKQDSKLKAPLLSLFLDSPKEVGRFFGAALLAAGVMLGSFYAIKHFATKPAQTFRDLSPEFVAEFFYAKHITYLPEVMQENIDRQSFYRSAIDYYTAFAGMLSGRLQYDKNLVFATSEKLFSRLRLETNEYLKSKAENQRAVEEKFLAKPYTAIIDIPAVRGESLAGITNRIFDKIDILHQSAADTFASRKATLEAFKVDLPYDYENYSLVQIRNQKKIRDSLAQIRRGSFGQLSDEEHMYNEAGRVSDYIKRRTQRRLATQSPKEYLSPTSLGPVAIPAGVKFASFLHNAKNLAEDTKIAMLNGSTFGERKPKKVREPLIGEIDPNLIKKTIARRKYELQLCYELALRRNQLAKGSMEWSWRINSRGKISDLELLSSTISDRSMERCVRRKITSWNFPRPRRGSVEVRYPFRFAKGRG